MQNANCALGIIFEICLFSSKDYFSEYVFSPNIVPLYTCLSNPTFYLVQQFPIMPLYSKCKFCVTDSGLMNLKFSIRNVWNLLNPPFNFNRHKNFKLPC